MRIIFTHKATIKLNEIYIFYKSIGKGLYGRRVRVAVLKKVKKLKKNPELGKIEENLEGRGFFHRRLVEGNYKIIYRIDEDKSEIYITDIFDTHQNPDKM